MAPGADIGKEVILTKFLGSGQKILSMIQNIHLLKTMVKKNLSLDIFMQVLSSRCLFFIEEGKTKAT